MKTNRSLIVAAAQMACRDGELLENLEHATALAAQAACKGVQLVLFPEFMAPGFRLTPELWRMGEPFDGPTTQWLKRTAATYGLYVGTSFLESTGQDFLNTFALAGPNGQLAGAVRKRNPSFWEAYFFKGLKGAPYIDTELGRIGVGICFDNHTFEVARAVAQCDVDLMLMPHSYFTPVQPEKMVSQADIDRLNDLPGRVARLYNEWFGVPVVVANKSGPFDSPVPNTILGRASVYAFSGRSTILDADGGPRAELGCEAGLATATVTLEPGLKRHGAPPHYSRYVYPGPPGRELLRLVEAAGHWNYARSAERRRRAAECVRPGYWAHPTERPVRTLA